MDEKYFLPTETQPETAEKLAWTPPTLMKIEIAGETQSGIDYSNVEDNIRRIS